MKKKKTHGYITRNFDGQLISYPRKYPLHKITFSKKQLRTKMLVRLINKELDKI